MSDVFISYARNDRAKVARLADLLNGAGVSVWWDWHLRVGGDFRSEIQTAIDQARKVIVLWSRHSVLSRFVADEASEGLRQAKLLPVSIDDCRPPLGFQSIQALKLVNFEEDIKSLLQIIGDDTAGAGGGPVSSERKPPVQRVALVIGNRNYGSKILENCWRDADAVAHCLRERGFKIITRLDAAKNELQSSIRLFQEVLREFGGIGVVYFCGHAGHSDGEDFLVPVDSPGGTGLQRRKDIVNMSEILRPVDSLIDEHPASVGTVVMYSASKGQVAWDGPPGGNSPFTSAFLSCLRNSKAELSEVIRAVAIETRERSILNQVPSLESSLSMDFHFNDAARDRPGVLKLIFIDACRNQPFSRGERFLSLLLQR